MRYGTAPLMRTSTVLQAHSISNFGNHEYRIVCKIGNGSFGDVYLGINIFSQQKVAIKIEAINTNKLGGEARIYKILAGGIGIPLLHWFGAGLKYNAMIMDLLGRSLEDIFSICSRKFSLKTVLLLADQLISRLEYIHAKSLIHRDIKPDNFVMGTGKQRNQVNVIDFGLATEYRNTENPNHIPFGDSNFIGTIHYASINTHLGDEQSRRDDMESLGYVLLYFCRGSLPWQGVQASTDETECDRVKDKKIATSTKVLCSGLPIEFSHYINHVRALQFTEMPNYVYLRQLFRDLSANRGFKANYVLDWTDAKPACLDAGMT